MVHQPSLFGIVAIITSCGILHSQPPTRTKSPDSEAVEHVLSAAIAAAPELGADLRIRLADSAMRLSQVQREQLLIDVFRSADRATYQLPGRSIGPSRFLDSEAGVLSIALQLNIDALSLKTRAIRSLIVTKPILARKLFLEIPRLNVPEVPCSSSVGHVLSPYYTLLVDVAKHTASVASVADRRRFDEVRTMTLTSLSSPFQLEPVARAIIALDLADDTLRQIVASYSSAMATMTVNRDHYYVLSNDLVASLIDLVNYLEKRGLSGDTVLSAFSTYISSNLSLHACRAHQSDDSKDLALAIAETAKTIRNVAKRPTWNVDIAPESFRTSTIVADPKLFWKSPESKALLDLARELRFGPTGKKVITFDANDEKVSAFTDKIDEWLTKRKMDNGSEVFEAADLYRGVIDLASTQAVQERAIMRSIQLLKESPLRVTAPAHWYTLWRRLVAMPSDSSVKPRFKEFVRRFGDPVMSSYILLDEQRQSKEHK